jgi:hypothetical protein
MCSNEHRYACMQGSEHCMTESRTLGNGYGQGSGGKGGNDNMMLMQCRGLQI